MCIQRGMRFQEEDLRDKKVEGGGVSVGFAITTEQCSPLSLAAHIHSPGISLLFLPAIVYQSKCAT